MHNSGPLNNLEWTSPPGTLTQTNGFRYQRQSKVCVHNILACKKKLGGEVKVGIFNPFPSSHSMHGNFNTECVPHVPRNNILQCYVIKGLRRTNKDVWATGLPWFHSKTSSLWSERRLSTSKLLFDSSHIMIYIPVTSRDATHPHPSRLGNVCTKTGLFL